MKKLVTAAGLAILVWSMVVSPVTLLAATGDTSILGQVPESLSITTPGTFSLAELNPGNTTTSDVKTVTITSNSSGWTLTVAESGGSKDGCMARTTDSHALTYPIQVKGGDVTSYSSLANTVTLESSGNGTTTISDIYFQQTVAASEYAGQYSITVVFTVTAGA